MCDDIHSPDVYPQWIGWIEDALQEYSTGTLGTYRKRIKSTRRKSQSTRMGRCQSRKEITA
jgi:hypothetical protein